MFVPPLIIEKEHKENRVQRVQQWLSRFFGKISASYFTSTLRMCSYLQLQPEGISGTQMHLITQGELAMKNSDRYVVITHKSFNTFTMCENTEERLTSGNVPIKRPLVSMKNAVGAK